MADTIPSTASFFCLTPHLNRLDMSARNKPPTINVTMFGELGVFK